MYLSSRIKWIDELIEEVCWYVGECRGVWKCWLVVGLVFWGLDKLKLKWRIGNLRYDDWWEE